MKKLFLFGISLAVFLPYFVFAADSDIVITEVAAYETSDHEWIEIFNKGTQSVDLTGWKFVEDGINHTLSAFRGDLIIEPGEYAVIADVAATTATDYPGFTGTLIDSSWSTLNENGELLALKNGSGAIIEQFTYISAPDRSLERVSASSNDYSAQNWKEHASGNSIGAQNSISQSSQQSQVSLPQTLWKPTRGDVLINEFVASPLSGQQEWIELYNATYDQVNLSGWTLEDGGGTKTQLDGTLGTLNDSRFALFEQKSSLLNNDGDLIILRDSGGVIIDMVAYGIWESGDRTRNAPAAQSPFSVARVRNGSDSMTNNIDFVVTQTPTKKSPNEIQSPSNSGEEDADQKKSSSIIISELLPEPFPYDPSLEFIELFNAGKESMDIASWVLGNASGQRFVISSSALPSTQIPVGGYAVFSREKTQLVLRNTGREKISLFDKEGKLISSLSYDTSRQNESFSRSLSGEYLWTLVPTPNTLNQIKERNKEPVVIFEISEGALPNTPILFDATDSFDPENDLLSFHWDFGDHTTSTDVVTEHAYSSAGAFIVSLQVRDASHIAERKRTVRVPSAPLITAVSALQSRSDSISTSVQESKKKEEGIAVVKKEGNDNREKEGSFEVAAQESDLSSLPLDAHVRVQGVISVEPGPFGERVAYLSDPHIQLYASKGNFPSLQRGDLVEVEGTIGKSGGERRIRISSQERIRKLGSKEDVLPSQRDANELGDDDLGLLVRVQGEVTEIKWPSVFLDDGTGEVKVAVKNTVPLQRSAFEKERIMEVDGILSKTSAGFRVLPRDVNDVRVVSNSSSPLVVGAKEEVVIPIPSGKDRENRAMWYLIFALAASATLLGGVYLKHRLSLPKK